MALIEIWVNCPDEEVAQQISGHLLEKRLVACSNIFGEMNSSYHWKGRVESETEVPLLLKTREDLFDEVAAEVRASHPYETPSIVGMPVKLVNEDYERWVVAETDRALIRKE